MVIDFAMTATCRPEIIRKTLSSFCSNLINLDLNSSTLYINIDPFPVRSDRAQVIKVCHRFFTNVVYNLPTEPNFCQAQKWVFENSKRELVFNLQDDWILLKRVDVDKMSLFLLEKHARNSKIKQARLPFSSNMNRNKMFLSPSLMIGSFCRQYAEKLNINLNPEIQIKKYGEGTSCLYPHSKISIVRDIGRTWLKENGFFRARKGPGRERFITWQR